MMLQREWSFSLPLVSNRLLQTWEIIYHGICVSTTQVRRERKLERKGQIEGRKEGRLGREERAGRRDFQCELHFPNQILMRLTRYLRSMTQRWQRTYSRETSFLFSMLQLFFGISRSVEKREDYSSYIACVHYYYCQVHGIDVGKTRWQRVVDAVSPQIGKPTVTW